MKKLLLMAPAFAAILLAAACGDDSTGGSGSADGGHDGSTIDGGPNPGLDGGGNPDGGPGFDGGPCDFNAFVLDLVKNHTTATDKPSTNLGESCTDTHTLVPQSTF